MVPAASGEIILNGENITSHSIKQRIQDGIAYIPEDRHGVGLVLDFPLKDNIALKKYDNNPFSQKGVLNYSEFEEYGKKLIERYDIRSSRGGVTVTRSMSGGNQQKAIIGREIDLQTPLIIFMQPTRGLDVGAIANIHRQIIAERDRGAAILLISLELDEIMNCADTIGVIFEGKINKIAPASELSVEEVGRFMMGVGRNGKEAAAS